ncbi:hypothetical protein MUK42_34362 [Musa troglodytarum]|uniref:Uncharacterized protein n=1 Tax=Musa troglodytarum TaxID=320322 RepID=A0A9E7K3C1_9LILI|nr:hypothetical protein MUK42_34362 [Musa troglodytarum]
MHLGRPCISPNHLICEEYAPTGGPRFDPSRIGAHGGRGRRMILRQSRGGNLMLAVRCRLHADAAARVVPASQGTRGGSSDRELTVIDRASPPRGSRTHHPRDISFLGTAAAVLS